MNVSPYNSEYGFSAYETFGPTGVTRNFYTITNLNYIPSDANYDLYIPSNTSGNGLETLRYNDSETLITITKITINYKGGSC